MCECVCNLVYAGVLVWRTEEQPMGAGSFLSPRGSRDKSQVVRLVGQVPLLAQVSYMPSFVVLTLTDLLF